MCKKASPLMAEPRPLLSTTSPDVEEWPLEEIALNAIRWRSRDDQDGKAMAQGDRRWLLRYIDRYTLGNGSSGQTLVEYGLLLALISVVVIAVLLILGPTIAELFSNIANTLNGTP